MESEDPGNGATLSNPERSNYFDTYEVVVALMRKAPSPYSPTELFKSTAIEKPRFLFPMFQYPIFRILLHAFRKI